MGPSADGNAPLSLAAGRWCIVLAAVLWSLSGAFAKLLTEAGGVQLGQFPITGQQIAFYRVFFAGLTLIPTLRRTDVSFRPMMAVMLACFASMNVLYVLALAWGPAAEAILLQYSAPLWMYLASVLWLGEPADRRSWVALVIGLTGIGVIIAGRVHSAQVLVVALALGSGVAYAGVMLSLRVLRDSSSRWLTVLNHLGSALVLVPFMLWQPSPWPAPLQLVILLLFGAVQMALPYWLVARGLRVVSPQEAGTLTLLEPLLLPVWAYLVSPTTETPEWFTFVGGACILGALAYRYWPGRGVKAFSEPEA